MSDLYSNYYVCSKCGQPCGEVPTPTTFSNGQHWAGKSSCYNAAHGREVHALHRRHAANPRRPARDHAPRPDHA